MKRQAIIIVFALFVATAIRGQNPAQLLNNWSGKSPIEKVYLHFDRDNYIAGETAWFKAYLYSDYQPDTISTSLYVELSDDAGVVLSRVVLPVLLGTASGQLALADSLETGYYLIRAYSPTMLNQDAGFLYKKAVFIYGRKNKTTSPVKEKMTRLEFFPEGGNLVSGFLNSVAFKITNELGLPVAASGSILNEKKELVTTFAAYHDGMGMFELSPIAGEKYTAIVEGDASGKKYELPEPTEKGIALTVMPHPQGNFFEIRQRTDNPAFQVAYMIGQMQHHIVFKQEFKTTKEEMQGLINTQKLHSGILQVTFFNKDDQPLAERLCFVDNKEYILPGQLSTDTLNIALKGKNRFTLELKDTVKGSFSVSIIDQQYDQRTARARNIFSDLLLTSDLKGYIQEPAYYFSGTNDSIKTSLDLVMMTNGWRRFAWTELSQKATRPLGYQDGSYITLSGKVNLRDTKKPFTEKPMLLLLITADSTRSMQMINTDKQGYFRLDSMLFFGKSKVLFSDITGKKSQYIDAQLSADSLSRGFFLPAVSPQFFLLPDANSMINKHGLTADYEAILKSRGFMLEGVTVKTKKKNPLQELDEKYTSGMFSGDAIKTIDLVSTIDAETYQNIFEYLRFRVPGIEVVNDGIDYGIYYRQNATVSSLGNPSMILYLNEIETDPSVIATIPANQIAMVKLYSSFAGAAGNAMGGVLSLYTKKGADMNDIMQSPADMVSYNGYSVIKEFYAPDYTVNKSAATQTDNRITLDWRPNIVLNNLNPRVPLTFYNNDRAKGFKVVIEGMTLDGRMLMIEKTIEGKKGF